MSGATIIRNGVHYFPVVRVGDAPKSVLRRPFVLTEDSDGAVCGQYISSVWYSRQYTPGDEVWLGVQAVDTVSGETSLLSYAELDVRGSVETMADEVMNLGEDDTVTSRVCVTHGGLGMSVNVSGSNGPSGPIYILLHPEFTMFG